MIGSSFEPHDAALRHVKEISSVAMLAAKWLVGVTPEVISLGTCNIHVSAKHQ